MTAGPGRATAGLPAGPDGHAVQPGTEVAATERAGLAGEEECDDDVDHEDPPVEEPHDAGGLAELLEAAALGREVLERSGDERA